MKKFKFSHFERYKTDLTNQFGNSTPDGFITKSIQTIGLCGILPESLDDIELELKIDSLGEMDIIIMNQQYYTQDELDSINDEISHINWDGYEFSTFFDIRDKSVLCANGSHKVPYEYILVGNINSDTFNTVTSSQNLANLKKMGNTLNKIK